MKREAIKKSQWERTLDIEILGKKIRSQRHKYHITSRMQEIEERISDAEDSIQNIDPRIKENAKCKKILTQNIQEIKENNEKTKSKDNRYR
jgi:cell division protein FtsL